MKRVFFPSIFLLLLTACSDYFEVSEYRFEPHYVVEGTIESNGYARVFVTRNMPYYAELDSSNIYSYIIRQAKVVVSDGIKSEVLTLKYSPNIFPPYYYQGTEIKGEVGKTYTLNVVLGDVELTAETTIPNPPVIKSVFFQSLASDPTTGTLEVTIDQNISEKNYYRFYTRILNKQNKFYPTLIPNFDGQIFPSSNYTISLSRGPENYMQNFDFEIQFSSSDTILLKACKMDIDQFNFWSYYYLEVAGGANPLATSYSRVVSNINGGVGNWGGFGVATFIIFPNEE